MVKLFERVKRFFQEIFRKNEIVCSLEIGDIVWAKRYRNESEKSKIREGHREGPYVIILKKKRHVYALYCTGSKSIIKKNQNNFYLDAQKYGFSKDTYVLTDKLVEITDREYIRSIGYLDNDDLEQVHKKISTLKIPKKDKNMKKLVIDSTRDSFSVGDIVNSGTTLYYIFDIDDKYLSVFSICKSKDGININGCFYNFKFQNVIKIRKDNKNIALYDFALETKTKSIEVLYRRYLADLEGRNVIGRGSVVAYEGSLYYIYGEYKGDWLVIKLERTTKGELKKLNIRGCQYYTDYVDESIPNKNLTLVDVGTLEDKDRIADERSKYKKKSANNKSKEVLMKSLQEKCLIIDSITLDRYIIFKRSANIIECVLMGDEPKCEEIDLSKKNFLVLERVLRRGEFEELKLKYKSITKF